MLVNYHLVLINFLLLLCQAQASKELNCVYYDSAECWNVEIKDHESCLTCKVDEANLTLHNEDIDFNLKNGTAFDSKIKMVHFEGGLVNYLPIVGIFEAFPQVHTISLIRTNTEVIDHHFFGKSYQLKYFKVLNTVGQTIIKANAFKRASNLLDIYFYKNDLKIHPDAFLGLTKIIDLSLVNGTIDTVEVSWFKDLRNLQFLQLASNMISKFNKLTFYNLKKLEVLCLDNNQIEFLDSSLFASNTNLVELSLQWNKIKEIQVGIFLGLVDLTKINLKGNLCIDENFVNITLVEVEISLVKCHLKG